MFFLLYRKTALMLALCRSLREKYSLAAVCGKILLLFLITTCLLGFRSFASTILSFDCIQSRMELFLIRLLLICKW